MCSTSRSVAFATEGAQEVERMVIRAEFVE
jgi:hypothetical protein